MTVFFENFGNRKVTQGGYMDLTFILIGGFDFFVTHNNGNYFVRPNPDGRFARFVLRNPDGSEKGWIFGPLVEDEEIYDPIRFGVLTADHECWHELKNMLRVRGVTFGEGNDFVPFSNGPTRTYVPIPNQYVAEHLVYKYHESEMRLVRKDFPNFLVALLNETAPPAEV